MKAFNTHKFITISSLTAAVILSTNCSTISTYRGDPSTWKNSNPVKKTKTVKKTKSGKKGGLAGFFAGLRGKKAETTETQNSAVAAAPTRKVTPNSVSNLPNPRVTQPSPISPRSVEASVPSRPTTGTASQKRRIRGLRAPEVDNIPSKKDLEEVESPSFKPSTGPGITVPTKP